MLLPLIKSFIYLHLSFHYASNHILVASFLSLFVFFLSLYLFSLLVHLAWFYFYKDITKYALGYPSLPDFSMIDQVLAATQTRREAKMKCFLGTSDALPKFIRVFEVNTRNSINKHLKILFKQK